MREIGQKIVRIESDLDERRRELASLSSMKATLASLQEQLQMLVNAYMTLGQLSLQMYSSAPPPPYV